MSHFSRLDPTWKIELDFGSMCDGYCPVYMNQNKGHVGTPPSQLQDRHRFDPIIHDTHDRLMSGHSIPWNAYSVPKESI